LRRGRKPKQFPLDFAQQLRAQGYSYDMIAWKLQQMGYNVSKWLVMRRLKQHEVNFAPKTQHVLRCKQGVKA
jgi:hypothetical protein